MWKVSGFLLVVLLSVVIGYILNPLLTEGFQINLIPDSKLTVTYPDMIAIILTSFGVIIAIASIGLAAAAIIGWNSIEGKAMNVAQRVTRDDLDSGDGRLHKTIKEAISDPSSPLHDTLKIEAKRLMFQGVSDIYEETTQPRTDEE